jgi:hypothetical protein
MARGIYAASRFPRTWRSLGKSQRDRVIDIILALPDLLKNPPHHSGFGIGGFTEPSFMKRVST